jgi:hypothetical protein
MTVADAAVPAAPSAEVVQLAREVIATHRRHMARMLLRGGVPLALAQGVLDDLERVSFTIQIQIAETLLAAAQQGIATYHASRATPSKE